MRRLNKWVRYLLYFFISIVLLFVLLFVYLFIVATVIEPIPKSRACEKLERTTLDTNCYTIGNNWLRKSKSGLWEMYVEGNAFERGVINGKLSKELIYLQEVAFTDQISKIVPSTFYRHFLKYFIGWFNRDLDENITDEYKLEIYGESLAASDEFNYIGSGYQRLMNYHAAHDIGHALQNLALVGCSSFATWNSRSEDSLLIAGRNFDFYVGDRFAENKIVSFYDPKQGHKFMMVTWGGMIGVVSGMNIEGLSVTINAAKSSIPSGSATPVSLLAREILQYASTIEEAKRIAQKRKSFVSESFFISSAKDNRSALLEKTPDAFDMYTSSDDYIICTNHYQGKELSAEAPNKEQMSNSASVYRMERIKELLARVDKNSPQKTIAILRDQRGLNDEFIGYGNEKAVNQLIAHHSIVFEPQKKRVWVSTSPWQLGEYVSYDLNKIFSMKGLSSNAEVYDSLYIIPADTFLKTSAYRDFSQFRKLKEEMKEGAEVNMDQFVKLNPEYYHTYVLAGDYTFEHEEYAKALAFYKTALTKEIATKEEEAHIKKQIELCNSETGK